MNRRSRRLRSHVTLAAAAAVAFVGPLGSTATTNVEPATIRPAGSPLPLDGRLSALASTAFAAPATATGVTAPAPLTSTSTATATATATSIIEGAVPSPASAPAPATSAEPAAPDTAAQPTPAAHTAITFALAQIGLPYVWGGNGPAAGHAGFDCSGLTTASYAAAGITLPRTAHTQYYAGPRLPPGSALQPGDLVFYGVPSRVHHVGLYLGDGVMVNAPTFGKPVQLAYYRWRGDDYLGAGRPSAGPRLPPISLLAFGPIPFRVGRANPPTDFVAPTVPAGSTPPIASDPGRPAGPDPFATVPPTGAAADPGASSPGLPDAAAPVPAPPGPAPLDLALPGPALPGPTLPGPTASPVPSRPLGTPGTTAPPLATPPLATPPPATPVPTAGATPPVVASPVATPSVPTPTDPTSTVPTSTVPTPSVPMPSVPSPAGTPGRSPGPTAAPAPRPSPSTAPPAPPPATAAPAPTSSAPVTPPAPTSAPPDPTASASPPAP